MMEAKEFLFKSGLTDSPEKSLFITRPNEDGQNETFDMAEVMVAWLHSYLAGRSVVPSLKHKVGDYVYHIDAIGNIVYTPIRQIQWIETSDKLYYGYITGTSKDLHMEQTLYVSLDELMSDIRREIEFATIKAIEDKDTAVINFSQVTYRKILE